MAGKKSRKKPEKGPDELLADTFTAALKKQEDFIVTFETGDDGKRIMHIMSGKLITSCMLGTLSNRCELPEYEGSLHKVLRQE